MAEKESKYEIMQLYPHTFDGHTLKRIRATKEFILNDGTIIKKGQYGGYVEYECNLSQNSNSWISEKARCYGNARVTDGAIVRGNATVKDFSIVGGHATVQDYAVIKGNSIIGGLVKIIGNTELKNAKIFDDVTVSG